MPRPPDALTLERLKSAVGPGGWLDSPAEVEPFVTDFRRLYLGRTPLVLLPRSVEEVARVVGICGRDGVAVVPQGGNTGYCGGGDARRVGNADRAWRCDGCDRSAHHRRRRVISWSSRRVARSQPRRPRRQAPTVCSP